MRPPLVSAGSDGPASQARAVSDGPASPPPRVFVLRVMSPCRSWSLAPPPLSCVGAAPGLTLVFVAACCYGPPAHPTPPLCLLSSAPPLRFGVAAPAGGCCRPPPPPTWFLFRRYWLFPLFPPCFVVALPRLSVCRCLLLYPPTPRFVFRGCRCPAARPPLFSLCLLVASRRWHVRPPGRFVFRGCRRPAARFTVSSCCFLVFSVPLGLAPVWLGFFLPPWLPTFRALCALRAGAVPPSPAVASGGVRCLVCCCVLPRFGVGPFLRRAVFFYAVLVCGCFAEVRAVLLCCCRSPVGRAVFVGVARCSAVPCCFVRCFVGCDAVVRCSVLWFYLWCCVAWWSWSFSLSASLVLCTCRFAQPGAAPPPLVWVLCLVPPGVHEVATVPTRSGSHST